jgi:hypothetical protein
MSCSELDFFLSQTCQWHFAALSFFCYPFPVHQCSASLLVKYSTQSNVRFLLLIITSSHTSQLLASWPCLSAWSDAQRFHLVETVHQHNASLAALFRIYAAKSAAATALQSNRGGGGGNAGNNGNGGQMSIDMFVQLMSDAQALDAYARSPAQVCFMKQSTLCF